MSTVKITRTDDTQEEVWVGGIGLDTGEAIQAAQAIIQGEIANALYLAVKELQNIYTQLFEIRSIQLEEFDHK